MCFEVQTKAIGVASPENEAGLWLKVGSACVRALLRRKRYVRRRLAKVCCYESMPAARCYSGSRDQVEIDQNREYI